MANESIKIVNATVDVETHKEMKILATQLGITLKQFVIDAVNEKIKKEKQ